MRKTCQKNFFVILLILPFLFSLVAFYGCGGGKSDSYDPNFDRLVEESDKEREKNADSDQWIEITDTQESSESAGEESETASGTAEKEDSSADISEHKTTDSAPEKTANDSKEEKVHYDYVVTSTGDSSDDEGLTLRGAIRRAASGDTIGFDPKLKGKTITLNGTPIEIKKDLTISAEDLRDGGKQWIKLDGNDKSSIFVINDEESVSLKLVGLMFGRGAGLRGGAIENHMGHIEIDDCSFFLNKGSQGGAIWQKNGDTTIDHSSFVSNSAFNGGAIWNSGYLTIYNSGFTGNHASIQDRDEHKNDSDIASIPTDLNESAENNNTANTEMDGGLGGAIYSCYDFGGVRLQLDKCIGRGNRGRKGGFIYCEGADDPDYRRHSNHSIKFLAMGCILSGNKADLGGGIYITGCGEWVIADSTIGHNTGGGCYSEGVDSSEFGVYGPYCLRFANSVVTDNEGIDVGWKEWNSDIVGTTPGAPPYFCYSKIGSTTKKIEKAFRTEFDQNGMGVSLGDNLLSDAVITFDPALKADQEKMSSLATSGTLTAIVGNRILYLVKGVKRWREIGCNPLDQEVSSDEFDLLVDYTEPDFEPNIVRTGEVVIYGVNAQKGRANIRGYGEKWNYVTRLNNLDKLEFPVGAVVLDSSIE